ncbi:MAG: hypothetical protein A2020_03905 [Lentisphaerae bacterium GWF2_45_14]|nr:MAG: hypothetical protein A2020_03905 [Lentisphaerae bacterium GWF2_45_14]
MKANLKCRYSLVELMCVMFITVALMALLIPSLERVKGMARKTFCRNNLQQMLVCTNLYKADNRGALPYVSLWLVDFSFLSNYITGFGMTMCPDTEDVVSKVGDLVGDTSYHYMGSRYDWERNNVAFGDGTEYGYDPENPGIAEQLSKKEERVIYDKSDIVHYGFFNVVHMDSSHVESLPSSEYANFWYYDYAGDIDLSEDATNNVNEFRNNLTYRHTNNGHGNNEDGVDCSNPGQGWMGKWEDVSAGFDDEKQ